MAVKLMHRGDSLFPMKITCSTCNSVLEVEGPRDLHVDTIGDVRISGPRRVAFLDCPECMGRIYIGDDTLNQVLFEYDKMGEWRGK